MKCQDLFSLKKKKKLSSAAVVSGTLKVNLKIEDSHEMLTYFLWKKKKKKKNEIKKKKKNPLLQLWLAL